MPSLFYKTADIPLLGRDSCSINSPVFPIQRKVRRRKINKKQKIVLWIGVVAFLTISVIPWRVKGFGGAADVDGTSSYKPTYLPIQPPELYKYWIVIGVVTGALIISLKESK